MYDLISNICSSDDDYFDDYNDYDDSSKTTRSILGKKESDVHHIEPSMITMITIEFKEEQLNSN